MAQVCSGLCSRLKVTTDSNTVRFRYKLGHKFCSHCALFFYTEKITCPCCKTKLRSKPKSKKHEV